MTVIRLRRWSWGELPSYNGFCHAERVRGWQLVNLLVELGQIAKPSLCSISGAAKDLQFHSENYFAPWQPYTLAQPIHMALHRRFSRPEEWREIVRQYAATGQEWFAQLSLEPVDLASQLRDQFGPDIANIFTRAPIPAHVQIPWSEVYGWATTIETHP